MSWLLWIAFAIVMFWVWVFIGTRGLCPSCGCELPDDWAYPGQRVTSCACGWHA